MKLPDGWPGAKLPKGWPEPRFDPRLVEAAQDPCYNQSIIAFETRLRTIFASTTVGAVINLPYISDPVLRRIHCLVARYYGLRPFKNSTISFATKNWAAPVYMVEDIPLKRALGPPLLGPNNKKEILVDSTIEKSKGEVPMVDDTRERFKGKFVVVDPSVDKVFDRKKFPVEFAGGKASKGNTQGSGSRGHVEILSHKEEVPKVPGFVEVGDPLKLGLGVNQTEPAAFSDEVSGVPGFLEIGASSKLAVKLNLDEIKSPNGENLMSSKRNRAHKWENEGEMLLSMRGDAELHVEAICALYRQERIARAENTFSLSELNFQKITLLVEFLTDGNKTGPRVRSPEELDEVYRGSIALCSWLVVTYANQIYDIYYNELDLLFFIFVQNL